MRIARFFDEPKLEEPVLVMSLKGWVDAAQVGTGAAEHLAADGTVIVDFDGDELFDFRSNRPVVRFYDGAIEDITWPELTITHRQISGRDILVMTGHEPDFRWNSLGDELVEVCSRLNITKLVTMGSVPAAVPHTKDPPMFATASDPSLIGGEDRPRVGTLIVPGAAINTLSESMRSAGFPTIGYWLQVPHYLGDKYAKGVMVMLQRLAAELEVVLDLQHLEHEVEEQAERLRDAVEAKPGAREYLERLEEAYGDGIVPSGDEIAEEIQRFLSETGDDAGPFDQG